MRDFTSELLRREIPRLLHLGDTGGPRLSRPGPAPSPLGRPAPRVARVLRAPTRRVSPRRNCSDVKSRVPYTLGHTGGPRLSRPDLRRRRPTPHPRPNPQPPHPRPGARSPRAALGAWRPHGPPRWPWRTMVSTLVGARVPRARRHPTPTRGSVVGRPAAPRAGGGPPGTSAPTIVSPAPTRPRRWLYNGPAREVPAPPSARGAHSLPPHASTPRASRAPRNSPPKKI